MEFNTSLPASQELVRRLFEAVPGAVLVVSTDGGIMQANQAAVRLLGLTYSPTAKRYLTGFVGELCYEDGSPMPIEGCPVTRCLATGQAQRSEIIGSRQADGSLRWGICTAIPLLDDATGRMTGVVSTTLDITDRKSAEERLLAFTSERLRISHDERDSALAAADEAQRQEQRERQRGEQERRRMAHVLEATTDFVGLATIDGQAIYINAAGRRMLGLPERTDAPLGMVRDFHPAWAAEIVLQQAIPAAIRDGNWSGETALLHRDGREIPVSQVILAHQDASGRVEYMSTLARDISASKQAEAAGRRHLFELEVLNRVGAICSESETDDDILHRVTTLIAAKLFPDNCGFLLLDAAREVLRPHPSFIITNPEVESADISIDSGITGRAARTGQRQRVADVAREQGYLASDSKTRSELCVPIRVAAKVVGVLNVESQKLDAFSEADERLMAAIADLVGNALERLRAEKALRESEQRFARFMQHLPGLAWIKDLAGRYVYANEALAAAFGLSPAEVYGKEDADMLPAATAALFRENDRRAMAAAGGLQVIESLPRPDGVRHSLVSKFHMPGPDGKASYVAGMAIDITERKRAEEALENAQRRLAAILQDANVGVWDWDLVTNDVVFSKEWKSQLGCAEHEIANRFEEWESRCHPADLGQTMAGVKQALADRATHYDVEFRMRHKDGSWRWILSRGMVIAGPDGQPARMRGIHLDVSERRRQEESLNASEARLRALIESSSDAIWSVDEQQRLVLFNATFLRLFSQVFGRTPVAGQRPHDTLEPRMADHWARQLTRALEGEAFTVTERYPVLGDPRDFQVQINPIVQDGRVTGVTLLSRDVTDLHRAVAGLQDEQSINRSMIDSISDGVVVCDERGRFKVFNHAAEHILGLGDVADSPDQWPQLYGLYHPDGAGLVPAHELPLARALRGQEVDDELLLVRRDDLPHDIWLSVNAHPLRDAAGRPCGGAVAAFRDVTAQRRTQEALEADREFKRRMLEAHDRDRKLISLEIHDGLVQDISAAKMYVEALQVQYAATAVPNKDSFKKTVKVLRRAVEEGRRIMSGLSPPVMDEFGVVAGIEYLVDEIQEQGKIQVSFHHNMQVYRLDLLLEGTLFRIAQEALNNVRRHSKASSAAVSLTQGDSVVRLEIRDSGVGFDLSRVAADRYGVRGIAERARLFSGSSTIESAPGKGTRIVVELPIQPPVHSPLTPSNA